MVIPFQESLQESISRQREALMESLRGPLARLAASASQAWGDRTQLNAVLGAALPELPHSKFLYALDTHAVQISDNVCHEGLIETDFGRDRAQRPYMREAVPSTAFLLSQAYISLRARRPSLTAIQIVRDTTGAALGFIGVDFDLRALPLTRQLYEEPRRWRQIKGDPSIRSGVFAQTRIDSEMDRHIDTVLGVTEELMADHGIFHVALHFSSSRAIVWLVDDPYRYRLLDINALIDPDVCLAYPTRPYPSTALVSAHEIRAVLDAFRALRFMDEMLYLRSGSLNIFNGIVGLTFSCDGSHYIPHDEFLNMDKTFWTGGQE